MGKGNPAKALAALLPQPIQVCEGVTVRPLTLAMFAVLERIKSPIITGTPCDTFDLVPSLYAITHDPGEVLADPNLLQTSMAWADMFPPSVLADLRGAAEKQIEAVLDVVPETKKKRISGRTDG